MQEFRFLDYHTVYSCKGAIVKAFGANACFGYVFARIRDNVDVTYEIIVYRGVECCTQKHWSNACLLTIPEIRNHLSLLNNLYPIRYSIDKWDDDYDAIKITLNISNAPSTFHKYALTWLRYIYEYPYNVILKDVIELRKDPIFRFESRANLLNLCISCFNEPLREVHQIPQNGIVSKLSVKDLKQRIRHVDELNDIYKRLKNRGNVIPPTIGRYSVHDKEYWSEGFSTRKEVYVKVYKDN